MNTQEVAALTERELGGTGWTVRRAGGGSKHSYLVNRGRTTIFVKLDVEAEPLRRLAELGVAPPLIASGRFSGRPFVLQEYVDGRHPDRTWFSTHLDDLAAFVRRYHDDPILRELLAGSSRPTDTVLRVMSEIEGGLAAAQDREPALHVDPGDWSVFHAVGEVLHRVPHVPVHPDPNRKNFLVTSGRFVIVDWDDVILSDPLRDAGMLLWWYVPRDKWVEFFAAYGLHPDDETYARIHWWAASTSLKVALWLAERGLWDEVEDFLKDFSAGARGRDNPHAGA